VLGVIHPTIFMPQMVGAPRAEPLDKVVPVPPEHLLKLSVANLANFSLMRRRGAQPGMLHDYLLSVDERVTATESHIIDLLFGVDFTPSDVRMAIESCNKGNNVPFSFEILAHLPMEIDTMAFLENFDATQEMCQLSISATEMYRDRIMRGDHEALTELAAKFCKQLEADGEAAQVTFVYGNMQATAVPASFRAYGTVSELINDSVSPLEHQVPDVIEEPITINERPHYPIERGAPLPPAYNWVPSDHPTTVDPQYSCYPEPHNQCIPRSVPVDPFPYPRCMIDPDGVGDPFEIEAKWRHDASRGDYDQAIRYPGWPQSPAGRVGKYAPKQFAKLVHEPVVKRLLQFREGIGPPVTKPWCTKYPFFCGDRSHTRRKRLGKG